MGTSDSTTATISRPPGEPQLEPKAAFTRRGGVEPILGDLYLFHLHFCDCDIGLRRLKKTRGQPWADPAASWWQIPADDCLEMLAAYDCRRRNHEVEIHHESPAVLKLLRKLWVAQVAVLESLTRLTSTTKDRSYGRLRSAFNVCFENLLGRCLGRRTRAYPGT